MAYRTRIMHCTAIKAGISNGGVMKWAGMDGCKTSAAQIAETRDMRRQWRKSISIENSGMAAKMALGAASAWHRKRWRRIGSGMASKASISSNSINNGEISKIINGGKWRK